MPWNLWWFPLCQLDSAVGYPEEKPFLGVLQGGFSVRGPLHLWTQQRRFCSPSGGLSPRTPQAWMEQKRRGREIYPFSAFLPVRAVTFVSSALDGDLCSQPPPPTRSSDLGIHTKWYHWLSWVSPCRWRVIGLLILHSCVSQCLWRNSLSLSPPTSCLPIYVKKKQKQKPTGSLN